MRSKWDAVEKLVEFAKEFSVKTSLINPEFERAGFPILAHGCKLYDLILRPQLTILLLAEMIPELQKRILELEQARREEIVEAAEISIKYNGYIAREEAIAKKLSRLEHVKIRGKFKYSDIHSLSTEARQKLEKIDPETVGQASRIPGISPSDVNILLLLLGR